MSSRRSVKLIAIGGFLATAFTAAHAGSLAKQKSQQPTPRIELVGAPILIADENTYNAFPDNLRLRDGEIFVVYATGQNHTDPRMKIQLRTSRDHGRTWGAPQTIVQPINQGYGEKTRLQRPLSCP